MEVVLLHPVLPVSLSLSLSELQSYSRSASMTRHSCSRPPFLLISAARQWSVVAPHPQCPLALSALGQQKKKQQSLDTQ